MLHLIKLLRRFFHFLLQPGPRYSWRRVTFLVLFSTMIISGSSVASYCCYLFAKRVEKTCAATPIRALVQTGPCYQSLQTSYLAEILDLSADRPAVATIADWKERLLATHVIQEVDVRRLKPDVLYVDYTLRTPIASLGDLTNTLLDASGRLFPHRPYYTHRHLPEIYLGAHAPPNPWGESIPSRFMGIVETIFRHLPPSMIEQIDLSHCETESAGRREIVLLLKGKKIVRLTPKNYPQQLTRYRMLEPHFETEESVIDLRHPDVAYVQRV